MLVTEKVTINNTIRINTIVVNNLALKFTRLIFVLAIIIKLESQILSRIKEYPVKSKVVVNPEEQG